MTCQRQFSMSIFLPDFAGLNKCLRKQQPNCNFFLVHPVCTLFVWGTRALCKKHTVYTQELRFMSYILIYLAGNSMRGMPGAKSGPTPIVRMYGVTMEGNSVLCHVHGFVPYFFVPAPQSFQDVQCSLFRDALNKAVIADMRSNKDNITQV